MPWVKAEYAGELAVLSAWLAALVPWSLTADLSAPGGSYMFVLRWPLFELQIRVPLEVTANGEVIGNASALLAQQFPGAELFGGLFVTDPVSAAAFYDARPLVLGSVAWAAGAVVVLIAVALSVAMYRDEAGTRARLPADDVRTMGGLLALATLAFAVATLLYAAERAVVGLPIPIGVVVVGALAVGLLRTERV